MNVSEARKKKDELRKGLKEDLHSIINEFEEKTGLYVEGISVYTSHLEVLTKESQHEGDKDKKLHQVSVDIDTDL